MASNKASVENEDIVFYPPKLWGLDFHFKSYIKMYIADILQMQDYPDYPGAFAYKNHAINKVEIAGTIVKRVQRAKCFVYAVDDATGVILCCIWKEKLESPYVTRAQKLSLPPLLAARLSETTQHEEECSQGYDLGDLVRVKGTVRIFREKKEICANIHSKLDDPNMQIFWMNELPGVYEKFYDKPFQPPNKVHQALLDSAQDADGKPQLKLALELKIILHKCVSESDHLSTMNLSDFQQFTRVKAFLSEYCTPEEHVEHSRQLLLMNALDLMEGEGHIVRRTDRRNLYELLLHKSQLEKMTLSILETEVQKSKYSEKGCHYLHIVDELRRTVPYSKVKTEAVVFCLNKLECQSDVISTTHAHYIPCF